MGGDGGANSGLINGGKVELPLEEGCRLDDGAACLKLGEAMCA